MLDGNVSDIHARFVAIKGEIIGIKERDRASLQAKVAADFNTTNLQLNALTTREHTMLWDKLKNGVGGISSSLAAERSTVQLREGHVMDESDDISLDQRRQVSAQKAEMDIIDRTQVKNENEIEDASNELLEKLSVLRARLSAELARIASQERQDNVKIRTDVVQQNIHTLGVLAAAADNVASKMRGELEATLTELKASFEALQLKEDGDHNELMGNLSAWQAAQQVANLRQQAWLQEIKDTCKGASAGIGGQIVALSAALSNADHKLTTHGTNLELDERTKAHQIDACIRILPVYIVLCKHT